jgi:hypothetical protein
VKKNQKAALYSTVSIFLYSLTTYLLFTFMCSSFLTTLLTLPFSFAFVVRFGAGDFMGYMTLAATLALIWCGCFFIFRERLKSKTSW